MEMLRGEGGGGGRGDRQVGGGGGGVTITELLRENGRVAGVRTKEVAGGATEEIRARWVVGDDGGHSIVREQCGIPMEVTPLPVEPIGFGIDWPVDFAAATAHGF